MLWSFPENLSAPKYWPALSRVPPSVWHVWDHIWMMCQIWGPQCKKVSNKLEWVQWTQPRGLEQIVNGERLKDLLTLEVERLMGDPGDPFSYFKGINGEDLPRGAWRQGERQWLQVATREILTILSGIKFLVRGLLCTSKSRQTFTVEQNRTTYRVLAHL